MFQSAGSAYVAMVFSGGKAWKPNSLMKRGILRAVGSERLASMPDVPVVTIALHLIVRALERRVRRTPNWANRDGRDPPRLKQLGQHVMEHPIIAILETLVERIVGFVPAPVTPALFHFVVAAPKRQRGVMTQAAHILDGLDAEILEEVRRRRDRCRRRT